MILDFKRPRNIEKLTVRTNTHSLAHQQPSISLSLTYNFWTVSLSGSLLQSNIYAVIAE